MAVKKGSVKGCQKPRSRFKYSTCLYKAMQSIVIFERSSKHFSRFIDLLRSHSEVTIKDIKKIVSHSSYYAIIIKKVYSINKILREINPNLYLAEPSFSITLSKGNVYTSLKRCELIDIETRKDFFIVRCKNA